MSSPGRQTPRSPYKRPRSPDAGFSPAMSKWLTVRACPSRMRSQARPGPPDAARKAGVWLPGPASPGGPPKETSPDPSVLSLKRERPW